MVFEPRFYREQQSATGLTSFEVVVGETDLWIAAEREMPDLARSLIVGVRGELEAYIAAHPRFAESFVPVPVDAVAPPVVQRMARAAAAAGVGPMAAVAGAVAEVVARGLHDAGSDQVIVENGGDVYLIGTTERTVALWAGSAGAAGVGLRVPGSALPLAVATSSGTVGPSVSYGSADAVAVLAASGALADAAASAIANRVHGADDLEAAMERARSIAGVIGCVATIGGAVAAWGAVELVPVGAWGK